MQSVLIAFASAAVCDDANMVFDNIKWVEEELFSTMITNMASAAYFLLEALPLTFHIHTTCCRYIPFAPVETRAREEGCCADDDGHFYVGKPRATATMSGEERSCFCCVCECALY